jgi:murein DD-endopeptidase MepM/ murein hydrolase activator NlpD
MPDTPIATSLPLPGLAPIGGRTAPESPARVRELAHQFEAMFLRQMLQQMRQSLVLAGTEDEDGYGKAAFTEQLDSELAGHLSASGGLGIADVIIQAFDKRASSSPNAVGSKASGLAGAIRAVGEAGTGAVKMPRVVLPLPLPPVVAAPNWPAVPDDVSSTQPNVLPLNVPMSSAFGWRRDPISGEGKFHRGVDLKAAYGQSVPNVAHGRVAFAGTQGGYGLTVVVEHESGIRTRYAHLSELAVQAGEVVSRGQDLGRVGSSGRSTGPHLHFEVMDNGKAVDPVRAAKLFENPAEFKIVPAAADSPIGGLPAEPAAEE